MLLVKILHSCQSHNVYQSDSVIRLLHQQRIFCFIIIHSICPLRPLSKWYLENKVWDNQYFILLWKAILGRFKNDCTKYRKEYLTLVSLPKVLSKTEYVIYSCTFSKDHNINYHGITKMRKVIYRQELLAFILFYVHYSQKTTWM